MSDNRKSIFYIKSPFQAFAAVEAMKHYNVSEYMMYVMPSSKTEQVCGYLDGFHVKYQLAKNLTRFQKYISYFNYILPHSSRGCDYLFIGNCTNQDIKRYSIKFVKPNGKIICLDDGNVTIAWFGDVYLQTMKSRILSWLDKYSCKLWGIKDHVYYTMFHDLHHKGYVIEPWDIKSSFPSKPLTCNNEVYIIGTCIEERDYGLTEKQLEDYYARFNNFMANLKGLYPNCEIIYIPHWRDKSNRTNLIVEANHCQFKCLDEIVELYLMRNSIKPVAVYGFGSTALFTLRCLYEDIPIKNVILADFLVEKNQVLFNEYYSQHKIENIYI